MTYCVKCGAKADDGDIFCRSCGAKIVRSAAGSSHGPAVSSPRTDGAAVTDIVNDIRNFRIGGRQCMPIG